MPEAARSHYVERAVTRHSPGNLTMIIRRNRTGRAGVGRRAFFVETARIAAAASAAFLVDGTEPVAAAWAALGGEARRRAPQRPFTMLAFGHSVMWGQALAAEQKFTMVVQHWLERALAPRTVQRFVFAHSGAKIGPCAAIPQTSCPISSDLAGPGETEVPRSFRGEIPTPVPTILDQIDRAMRALPARGVALGDVDLVLIDGGINDVSVEFILNPATLEEQVRSRTQLKASAMQTMVSRAAASFPNAKIAVLGYYPIITAESNPLEVSPWLQLLGFLAVGAPVIAGTAAALGLPPGATTAVLTVGVASGLVNKSRIFYEESTTALKAAVDRENTRQSYTASAALPNGRSPGHVVFVEPGFTSIHGYAAPESWLFKFSESTSDAVAAGRASACAAVLGTPTTAGQTMDLATCQRAAIGHPNPTGAAAYAAAIERALTPFLENWGGHPTSPPQLALEVNVGPVNSRTKRATLTVIARDSRTNEVRSGSVAVLDAKQVQQASGTTGRTIEFTPCREFDSQLKTYVGPGSCEVRVNVPGYPPASTQASAK